MSLLIPLSTNIDLVQRTYDAILNAICNGEIGPNERLTQETLAQMLGVSRQPVMQAIKLLEKDGLVQSLVNKKGLQIVPLNATVVSQLYLVRAVLDALAAKSAATIPRPELRDYGYTLLKNGRIAAQQNDLPGLVKADIEFHQYIYEACANPILLQTAALHWPQTRRVMSAYLRHPSSFRSVWNEHQAILDAVIKGEARLAERLSRHHALDSVELLFKSHINLGPEHRSETQRYSARTV
jgi:DNA-binding GntR family transcriptional regulator